MVGEESPQTRDNILANTVLPALLKHYFMIFINMKNSVFGSNEQIDRILSYFLSDEISGAAMCETVTV